MKLLIKNQAFWIISGFMFLGLVLRLYDFNSITFGYDQARDAIVSYNLWKGDLKILGPTSDISGLHHGILYWYIISPLYFLSNLNVYVVKLFLILTSLSVIPLTYIISKSIFQNKTIALFSAFITTVSFEFILYSHWLSNPALAVITICLSFLFLWKYVNGYRWGLFFTFFFWALSVHFEIFLLYELAVFAIILLIYKKIKPSDILFSLLIAGFVLSPFLLAEIKFQLTASKGILSFFTHYSQSRGQTLGEMAERAVGKATFIPYYNVLSSMGASFAIIFLLTVSGAYFSIFKKDKKIAFLLIWLLFPATLFFVGSTNIYFAFIGSAVPFCILFSYFTYNLIVSKKLYGVFAILITFILSGNIILLTQNAGKGEDLFSVQGGMVLNKEQEAIDWMYEQAHGKPFRINTITNPLFVNTTWTYLFDWYGQQKYGYMPFYWGYPQNGRVGEEISYSTNFNGSKNLLYLIIEPTDGIPDFYVKGIRQFEDSRTRVTEVKKFGNFTIEKRVIIQDLPFSMEQLNKIIKN